MIGVKRRLAIGVAVACAAALAAGMIACRNGRSDVSPPNTQEPSAVPASDATAGSGRDAGGPAPHPGTGGAPGKSSPETPSDILVAYRRSGGFAGFQDALDIHRDGRVVVSRRAGTREMKLDPARLAKLDETLKAAGIEKVPAESLAKGADLFSYSLTYGGRTVTFMDTAVPPSLQGLVPQLNAIVDEAMAPR